MNQSFIIISNISEEVLMESLMDFANLYSGDSFTDNIEIYREKETYQFLILFTNKPSFDHFCFAINYLRYVKTPNNNLPIPFGYFLNESENYSFLTKGFIKVYVSSNDKEYDNVNIVNNLNESYLFNFSGNQKKLTILEESFEVPSVKLDNYYHVLNIIPEPIEKESKPWWKFW